MYSVPATSLDSHVVLHTLMSVGGLWGDATAPGCPRFADFETEMVGVSVTHSATFGTLLLDDFQSATAPPPVPSGSVSAWAVAVSPWASVEPDLATSVTPATAATGRAATPRTPRSVAAPPPRRHRRQAPPERT